MTKYTPGPWHIDEAEFEATIYTAKNGDHDDQREVATVKILRIVKEHGEEDLANAAAIAAVPDLIDACAEALRDIRSGGKVRAERLIRALTKAGVSP